MHSSWTLTSTSANATCILMYPSLGFLRASPPGPSVSHLWSSQHGRSYAGDDLHRLRQASHTEGSSPHPRLTIFFLSGKATVMLRAERQFPLWEHHPHGVQIQEPCTSIRSRASTERAPEHPIVAHNIVYSDYSWTTSTTSLFKTCMNYWWCSGALLNCLVGQQEHSVVQMHQNA